MAEPTNPVDADPKPTASKAGMPAAAQGLMTAFFKPLNPEQPYWKTLFEKEEAERKARGIEAPEEAQDDGEDEQVARNKRMASFKKRTEGSLIVPNIYLGGQLAASNREWITSASVQVVINVTPEANGIKNFFPETLKYFRVSIADDGDEQLEKHIDGAFDFLDEAIKRGESALVHCAEGKSRRSMSLSEAEEIVKSNSAATLAINEGFLSQLRKIHEKRVADGKVCDVASDDNAVKGKKDAPKEKRKAVAAEVDLSAEEDMKPVAGRKRLLKKLGGAKKTEDDDDLVIADDTPRKSVPAKSEPAKEKQETMKETKNAEIKSDAKEKKETESKENEVKDAKLAEEKKAEEKEKVNDILIPTLKKKKSEGGDKKEKKQKNEKKKGEKKEKGKQETEDGQKSAKTKKKQEEKKEKNDKDGSAKEANKAKKKDKGAKKRQRSEGSEKKKKDKKVKEKEKDEEKIILLKKYEQKPKDIATAVVEIESDSVQTKKKRKDADEKKEEAAKEVEKETPENKKEGGDVEMDAVNNNDEAGKGSPPKKNFTPKNDDKLLKVSKAEKAHTKAPLQGVKKLDAWFKKPQAS